MTSLIPVIEFSGFVSHNDITRLINEFDKYASKQGISNSLIKKVLIVMIEILENNFHYIKSIRSELPSQIDIPYFSIFKRGNSFNLISINPIKQKDIDQLKNRIIEINNCEKTFLKELYLKRLIDSINTNKTSPGVGLIRIAKITQNKINCSFNHFDNKFLNYRLEIIVNSNKVI